MRIGVICKIDDEAKELHLIGGFGTSDDWMMGANTINLDNGQVIHGVFNWEEEETILEYAKQKGYTIVNDPVDQKYLKVGKSSEASREASREFLEALKKQQES